MSKVHKTERVIHKECGGDIEYIALSNCSKTKVRCMKCFEEWEIELERLK